MSYKNTLRKLVVSAVFALGSQAAFAAYPEKPIRLVVHFPAGSSTDVIARLVSEKASDILGQPIVITNKPGADGAIAAMDIKRSAPDGYSLLIATNSPMSGVPVMKKQPMYDPVADFTPVADVGRYSFFVYTRKALPAKTLPEFIAYAKANPGKLAYGSGNITGLLSFAYIASASGLDMLSVPYKGEPPAITDMLGGRVDAMVATAGTGMPQVKAGEFVALATVLPSRSPNAPDVPTMKEVGLPNFPIAPWLGVFGPAGMPADVVSKLNDAFSRALQDPKLAAGLQAQDFMPMPSKPETLQALVKDQLQSHRTLLRQAGLEASD